jgi:predicted regulator of Ras-like GTPase activity (Roadblock/LC7/MglB family)
VRRDEARTPLRDDTEGSVFAEILSELDRPVNELLAAVFYDGEGETVDYFTFVDPYQTKLIAAYHGVLVVSAASRFDWLNMGGLEELEIRTQRWDSFTVRVGDGYYLTVMVETGEMTAHLQRDVARVAGRLREETGL